TPPAKRRGPKPGSPGRPKYLTDPMLKAEWENLSGGAPITIRGSASQPDSQGELFEPLPRGIHQFRGSFAVAPANSIDPTMPHVAKIRALVDEHLKCQGEDLLPDLNGRKGVLWGYRDGCVWTAPDGELLARLFWTMGRG